LGDFFYFFVLLDLCIYDKIFVKVKGDFMRKSIFLMVVLSLCVADFGAFAAAARGNARGANNVTTSNVAAPAAPVAARAGARQKVVSTPTAASNAAAPVAARAGARQKVVSTPNPSAGQPMAARAGATQKVVSNGTKVAAATTNTVVPQECQDAFYGCMDSFCMIDNESGGRCQCSDRNAELKTVMEEIAKLDEQSYIMATEGVKRIEMGENADAIIAAAKAAGDKATGKATDTNIGTKVKSDKKYQLDLSAWNNNVFGEEDEDIFQSVDVNVDTSVINNALAKTGNALYVDSAKMCLAQMPAQCKDHLKILQNMYAQKIRSDCTAFENKLKQDKIASSQKLRTAEEALRDAALQDFQDKNKYNLGGCVQEYSKCMKNECGSDYTKCITLSAQENMKGGAGDKNARTIKGVVDIVLSGSTMNQLMSKKTICDGEVLVHCENVRAQVWDKYIEGAATELKSAELAAEDNMRQNCIKTTADCFKNACAAQWNPESDATNYDMCLSDPMLVFDSCKIQVEACVAATGGASDVKTEKDLEGSRLWKGVTSMLRALQVDQCTKEVKQQIESICGANFAHCVGLNPGSIAELMPIDSLTACMKKNNNDKNEVLSYISEIAQGYALTMNDELYAACENAAKQAMISVCGDAETCDSLEIDSIDFASLFKVQLCNDTDCKDTVEDFTDNEIVFGNVTPHIRGRLNPNKFEYTAAAVSSEQPAKRRFAYTQTATGDYVASTDPRVKSIMDGLNNVLARKIAVMESNKTVKECMNGKNVTGFKTKDADNKVTTRTRINNGTTDSAQDEIYANLLDNYIDVLVYKTLSLAKEQYYKAEKDLQPQLDAATDKISARLASIEGAKAEEQHQINENNCTLYALDKNMETNGNDCDCKDDDIDFSLPYPEAGSKLSKTKRKTDGDCNGYARDPNNKNNIRMCNCFNYDGFCQAGDKYFFSTGEGRNRQRQLLKYTTSAYDRATSTCTLTTTEYKCANYLSPYCWSWDQTGVKGETEVKKMPTVNIQDVIKNSK
jgi:hypothetical protein